MNQSNKQKFYPLFAIIVFIALYITDLLPTDIDDTTSINQYQNTPNDTYQNQSQNDIPVDVWCELVRVVDGDTIIVNYENENTRVRLIGINTPESVHQDESKNTQEGVIASDYVKELLSNVNVVGLEFDIEKYDQYDRILAYVYLEDGTMLNAHLLSEGYADIMTYKPNVKYLDYFESII